MMRKILQKGHDVLDKKAAEIDLSNGVPTNVQKVIEEMKESLAKTPDGVALAAPQIGESLRIFVVSPRAYDAMEMRMPEDENLVYINPIIKKRSFDKKKMEEGCLSVRGWYGNVKRSTRAKVEAYDENGQKFRKEGQGLLAQIFQHEIDHLDGVLFDSKAKNLREVSMENYGDEN